MKNLYIFMFVVMMSVRLMGQGCLPEGITFTTQEQIDSFPVNYPGCTEIGGNVDIMNGQITNLLGLSNITAIGGRLTIGLIEELTTLSGLDNLTTIGDYLYILNNENLTNLTGLNQLVTIGSSMSFYGNPSIENFEGLNNLNSIGGDFFVEWNENLQNFTGLEDLDSIGGRLDFFSNQFLLNLSGLDSLKHIGGEISIQYNTSLSDIQGLSNLEQGTINNLNISSNPALHECQILPFCQFLSNPTGSVNIYSNGAGCNNPAEIAESCGFALGCLPYGNYWVKTQQEADNFFQNFPDCNDLKGDLTIGGSSLNYVNGLYGINSVEGHLILTHNRQMNNLIGLESLIQVGGNLYIGGYEADGNEYLRNFEGLENLVNFDGDIQIIGNYSLVNLQGLSGIDSVNDLSITTYPGMIDLSGLDSLTSVMHDLHIAGYSIKHLDGLEKIDSINGNLYIGATDSLIDMQGLNNLVYIGEDLSLSYNKSLNSLADLINLKSVHNLAIWSNESLTSLHGLDSINGHIISYMYISDNQMLSHCEVKSICDYLVNPTGTVEINDNASGCNSRDEVEAACTVGINEKLTNDICTVFPNPSSGLLRFSFTITEPTGFSIEIVNSLGHKIKGPEPGYLSSGTHEIIWNASHLPDGIYFYRLQTNSQTASGRIVLKD
jgi:hypothetical protein